MIAADLLATVWWPMVAVTLVLCGMTLASGGRPSTGERRAAATAPGGRRATDRLPGDRTMVVVTPSRRLPYLSFSLGFPSQSPSTITPFLSSSLILIRCPHDESPARRIFSSSFHPKLISFS